MARLNYLEALGRAEVLRKLAAFDPHVVGTPPLALDLPTSDVDVICFTPDAEAFASAVWAGFGTCPDFSMWQKVGVDRPIVAKFGNAGWIIEVFGQASPISEQFGWRRFVVEQRLLAFGGDASRFVIMTQRASGMKTEPAFAAVLDLDGDPYQALLSLEHCLDTELTTLLRDLGFS